MQMLDKLFKNPLLQINSKKLIYQFMPNLLMEVMDKYFRLEIEGIENIPREGPTLVIPNHSGFSGLDAMILSHEIFKHKHRIPRVLTHYLWFATDATAKPAHKLGFIEATKENGLKELKHNHLLILFPEGERGNFKPSKYAYQLQEFKRGFVRMSLETRATIVPTVVIGAEETHINLKKLKIFKNISVPLPFNIFPLPVKWKIIFLPAFSFPYSADAKNDSDLVHRLADDLQTVVQNRINQELKQRPGVFLDRPIWLDHLIKKLNFK